LRTPVDATGECDQRYERCGARCRWRRNLECDLERPFLECAHPQNRETDHVALLVDLLHDLVVRSFPEIPWLLFEEHLEIISLGVEPDLQFSLGHSLTPCLILSVR
jgi:hypothetical protein